MHKFMTFQFMYERIKIMFLLSTTKFQVKISW